MSQRGILTTYDPDTLERDGGVLRDIHRRFGGAIALNTSVVAPGRICLGDPVRLLTEAETLPRAR